MKRYGDHCGIYFELVGWCIYNLAYKYRVYADNDPELVYADNLRHLKKQISEIANRGPEWQAQN